ncbi:putative membrane protein [Saccharopolyspora erythraea NRRL 2338]|uniref:YhgE/Pip domain-containing protein n=1 Tax=Saccharopolyspora erythraea TaxID=1836 RepID=UPI0003213783|nr:YhgE/Pip domain-containing protein [Saccharopolyspora erythraea]PFG93579.1 putative membrane protein [Saccharopolyspora erythraea NRRL 2338]QRK90428.1 YhgE/Pip family protein [Saccharopolyspora erythraea]
MERGPAVKAIRLARLEFLRFRGPVRRWVPLVLILVPLLYGGLYLWSNWDPYGRLGAVPVAVVNNDRPVLHDRELIDAGGQFVGQLKAARTFDWHFTDGADARRGLEQGRYYFTIEVPRDFSAKLASAADAEPKRAELLVTKNDANGFIVGIMADTVKSQLQNQINAAAHASYARALYGELDQAREKLQMASEASKELVKGSELGEQGTAALTKGLSGVRDGAGRISRGVSDISSATAQLDAQIGDLTDVATEKLPDAVGSVVGASGVAVRTLDEISTATAAVRDGSATGVTDLQELARKHPAVGDDPVYRRALDNARRLSATATATSDAAERALGTAQDADSRARALQKEVEPLREQVRESTGPMETLTKGTGELEAGSRGVTSGLSTLVANSGVLQTGADQLNTGAKRIEGLIAGGLDQIPPTNPGRVAQAADVLASPARIETANLNPASVYGRGLAPFFFSIALWVFGLFAYLLLRPLNSRAVAGRVGATTITLAGYLPAAALGVVGGLLLYGAVDLGLGLQPRHMWWTIGLVALAVAAFVAIDHLLRTAFGAVGGLLSLVLLMVQLTACGGLYPVETTPGPFQVIHPYLPMTYLVDGLRVTISGGLTDVLVRSAVMLAGFLVVALAMTTAVVMRQRMWTVGRLHPQVAL